MTERRYDDDEVALILHRAVEATTTNPERAPGMGLSLGELKEIGAEAGISRAGIEMAARTLDVREDPPATGSILGFRTTVQLERVVPVRLDAEHLPQLLDLIRNEFARQGIVEEVLGGFEWRARSGTGGRYVSIRSEGDQTRIRVLGNYRDGLLACTLGVGPVMTFGMGALAAALGAATPFIIVPVALVGGASSIVPWKIIFGREKRSLHRVLDALEQRLLELGETGAP